MKFYLCMHGGVVGPYRPEEIFGLFGAVAPHTPVCPAAEHESGRTRWREAGLFPELAGCVRRESSEPPAKRAAESAGGPALNILSTDDDSNIRELLWQMLTDAGHTVDFAREGEEVFKRLAAKKYDLLILDVNMPTMNGYKVSELLHEKLPDPPKVIIFTGRDLEKERLQFVCSGADAILNKGTGNDKLLQTIESLFPAKAVRAAPAAEMFTPEPSPAIIEEFSSFREPITLQKEEFYGAAAPEKPRPAAPPVKAVPRYTAEIAAPKPAAAAGAPDASFNRLFLENKALKADLVDIRRLLGHIELEYTQLEGQFEKQALKILGENREVSRKLEADWKSLRNYAALALLLLLAAVLAALLRP